MTEPLQPGPHLDADQLAAFAEGALTERERQDSLLHLAGCAQCRHILFLAQTPLEEALPAPKPVVVMQPASYWRRPALLVYATALAACLVTGYFVLRPQHPATPPADVARVEPPSALDKVAPPQRAAAPEVALSPLQPKHRQAPKANAQSKSAGVLSGSEDTTVAVPAIVADRKAGTADQVAAAPAPAADAVTVSGAEIQDLPLNNRNFTQLATRSTDANAALAKAQGSTAPPPADGPLTLRIEHGQNDASSLAKIAGAVLDPTGASVPGATVTLRQATAAPRQAKTDALGNFSLAGLPAGHYNLQIVAPGFATVAREIDLRPSDLALLTSQLPIDASTETVSVSAAIPTLQTESASMANLVEQPSERTMETTVAQGKRVLGLDAAGAVYLGTDHGKRWKKVKPVWGGRISRIAASGEGFEITTDAGVVWLSGDGKHWRQR